MTRIRETFEKKIMEAPRLSTDARYFDHNLADGKIKSWVQTYRLETPKQGFEPLKTFLIKCLDEIVSNAPPQSIQYVNKVLILIL